VPTISTFTVLAAVATMIALGIWQLGRKAEKEALIAQYEAAIRDDTEVVWSAPIFNTEELYRRATIDCDFVREIDSVSGKSARGQSGWVHVAECAHVHGIVDITIGWSQSPQSPQWSGGRVTGRIAPYGDSSRLVVETPQAGLQPLAMPDPGDLPNNHLAYAGQWFFFALTALIIYVLALRRGRR
jgi:surfeit locus 1 family protein